MFMLVSVADGSYDIIIATEKIVRIKVTKSWRLIVAVLREVLVNRLQENTKALVSSFILYS